MNTAITDKFDPNLKKTWYERTPMGRMGHVTDLNGAAIWLLSPASNYVTGTDVLVGECYRLIFYPQLIKQQTVVTVLCKILELNEFPLHFLY